jgi:hypothetical protein
MLVATSYSVACYGCAHTLPFNVLAASKIKHTRSTLLVHAAVTHGDSSSELYHEQRN